MFNIIVPIVAPNRINQEQHNIEVNPQIHWPQETPDERFYGSIIIFSFFITCFLLLYAYLYMLDKKTVFSKILFWLIPIIYFVILSLVIYFKNYKA